YQCPPCAATFENTVPRLQADYVQPGKVRLLYRDFPLAIHPYARVAARYADAAGVAGAYDAAAAQIFRTQAAGAATGAIDAQLAAVLSPETLQDVRNLVNEASVDEGITADLAMGLQDQIVSTPTFVVVAKGKREKIPLHLPYEQIRAYLDQYLKAAR